MLGLEEKIRLTPNYVKSYDDDLSASWKFVFIANASDAKFNLTQIYTMI